jgi:hypothetical protein
MQSFDISRLMYLQRSDSLESDIGRQNAIEESMATYSVKLVDHRSSTHAETAAIAATIARVMGLAFVGTRDSVNVSWGSSAASDDLVLHFVEDIAHSYLRQTWPQMTVDPNAGGHTHMHGSLAGTELYRTRPSGPLHLRRYGALAFHEALHNLFPFRSDQHTAFGGGIAAAHIPDQDPNDANKAFLRQGFSVRTRQLL